MNNGYEKSKDQLIKRVKIISENKKNDYNKSPILCKCCSEPIPYHKRFQNIFCNRSCSMIVNNKKRTLKNPICIVCSKPNLRPNYKSSNYCSGKCKSLNEYNTYINRWLNNLETGIYKNGITIHNYIRKYLLEIKENKCEQCGWDKINPKTLKCPLAIDHINGNWRDNNLSNLRLLCPSCHSLTPTYGSLNNGNGRP